MNRIIVTGATSFIGRNLVKKLAENNFSVYAIVRKNSDKICLLPNFDNIKIIELDMSEYDKLDSIIVEDCDIFVSVAWEGTRGINRNDEMLQSKNYIHALNGIKAAFALNCKEIILVGSQAEYGKHSHRISETTKCEPVTEYGKWKLKLYNKVEKICSELNIKYKEVRLFSIYGPGDYYNTMIMSTIDKMLRNEDCEFTAATQIWDYLYIDDAIEGIMALIDADCANGVYNIGSGEARQLKEYIFDIKSVINSSSKMIFSTAEHQEFDKLYVCPDVEKLLSATGMSPKISFIEGIRKVIKEYA